nr:MAG TPA: portal protein [Caudoviricetes sp.]
MWPFKSKTEEIRADTEVVLDTQLLSALLLGSTISREKAMQIPAVSACVSRISETVAMIPFKLYKVDSDKQKLTEVRDDVRTKMLNMDTGDTLDAFQMKKALIQDYLLDKGGYAYIERYGNKVKSIRYVDSLQVAFSYNADPIFKDYKILVGGKEYYPYQFLKLLRNTKDGFRSVSVIEESSEPFSIAYGIMRFQNKQLKIGGNKRGFVKSDRKLSQESLDALKDAWTRLYSDENAENVVILNDGLEFQESSASQTEMQLNENINTLTRQICQIFGVPYQFINREATPSEEDRLIFMQYCIQPILTEFENALNRDFLLESEKGDYKWVADASELTKADILRRYQAYEVASKNGFMQIDEIRFKENLEPLGLDFVKLGLQDVLYYPKKGGMTFVPNMNQVGGIELATEDRERMIRKEKEEGNEDSNTE